MDITFEERQLMSLYNTGTRTGLIAALEEMLTVARALQTPLEISHLKAIGRVNWRAAVPQMLAMMESAREDGVALLNRHYPKTNHTPWLSHRT